MPRVSTAVGHLLKAGFSGILAFRRPRPIHPHGVALAGEVSWLGSSASGVRWVDEPPKRPQPVIGRASRSIGIPAPFPDIIGLALRFDTADGPADLELASTGMAVPTRFSLFLHRSPSRARLTTLLPYRGTRGDLLIGAVTISPRDLPPAPADLAASLRHSPWRLRLLVARPFGRWHPFAEVTLSAAEPGGDSPVHFDAGRFMLPGATMPPWVWNAREPSYRLTRERGSG